MTISRTQQACQGRSGILSSMALHWIGIAAPIAGFTDLIVSLLRMPPPDEYEVASTLLGPLATTTLTAALLFTAIWILLLVAGRWRSGLAAHPLLVSLTLGLLCLELLLLLLGVLVPAELAVDPATTLIKLAAAGFISLLLLRGTYLLGCDITASLHTRRSPVLLVLAAPALCGLLLQLIWFTRFQMNAPLLSPDSLKAIALTGLAGLVLLPAFYFFGHGRAGRAASLLPLCFILVAPVVVHINHVRSLDPSDIPRSAKAQQCNVFLITIDSLRADTLSCYGSTTVETRSIDYIAGDGIVFNSAISASSWTLPAVASFMTGVSPVVHGATAWQKRLPDDFKTLAEYFKEAGYHTVALGQNPVLDEARNLDQGFDEYDWISTEVRHPGLSIGRTLLQLFHAHRMESTTEQITRMAVEHLEQVKEGPVFMWIHYYDPHMPYTPPTGFLSEATAQSPYGITFDGIERVRMGRFGTTQPERDWVKALYEGEVRFVDGEIGQLLTSLKDHGLYDDGLVVLASDHGEEFWEHGGFEHGHSMHQELLRVPLIIKQPNPVRPGRVDATVAMEGLTPTILELAGIPVADGQMTAASFASYLNLDQPAPVSLPVSSFGTLYFEKLEAVTGPQFKYIRSVEFGHEVLYDRLSDPLELHPFEAGANPAAAERARGFLDRVHNRSQTVQATDQKDVVLDAGTEDSLRSLGYID